MTVREHILSDWRQVVDVADWLSGPGWVFRGQEDAEWTLRSSLEREFAGEDALWDIEHQALTRFVRLAPRFLSGHLVPNDDDAAAWLGLIQHYGGPTRLLDVSRSPYVALYFAFEPTGAQARALWAIDGTWCARQCAQGMANNEGIDYNIAMSRVAFAQAQLIGSVVHNVRLDDPRFSTFCPFTGVFPFDPWKPDIRQVAQQAQFLCAANLRRGFMDNLSSFDSPKSPDALLKFSISAALRYEILERLATMNVTAATLFPDLGGLARSLRTSPIRRSENTSAPPPWSNPQRA